MSSSLVESRDTPCASVMTSFDESLCFAHPNNPLLSFADVTSPFVCLMSDPNVVVVNRLLDMPAHILRPLADLKYSFKELISRRHQPRFPRSPMHSICSL